MSDEPEPNLTEDDPKTLLPDDATFHKAVDAAMVKRTMPWQTDRGPVIPGHGKISRPRTVFQETIKVCLGLRAKNPDTWKDSPEGREQIVILQKISQWWSPYSGGQ